MNQPTDTIDITCSKCSEKFRLPRSAIGRSGKCKCGNLLIIKDSTEEISALRQGLQKLVEETSSNCSNHPDANSIGQCIKCQQNLCSACAKKTKAGTYVCEPCLEAHRAKSSGQSVSSGSTNAVARPLSGTPPTNSSKLPVARPVDTEVYEAEVIETPASYQQSTPSNDIFGAALDTLPTYSAPGGATAWPAASSSSSNSSSGWGAYGGVTSNETCKQHPGIVAVHHCTICKAPVCRTCVFVFPPNITCCPKCATDTEIHLSNHRKWMIYASLACAIFGTLFFAFVFSGILSFLAEMPFGGLIIESIAALILCSGVGLAFGSLNSQEGNTITLWVAGIWNLVILLGWMFFLIVFSFIL